MKTTPTESTPMTTMADTVNNEIKTIDGRKHYKYNKDGSAAEIDTDSKYYVKLQIIPPIKLDRQLIINPDNFIGDIDPGNCGMIEDDGPYSGDWDIADPYDPRVKHIREDIMRMLMMSLKLRRDLRERNDPAALEEFFYIPLPLYAILFSKYALDKIFFWMETGDGDVMDGMAELCYIIHLATKSSNSEFGVREDYKDWAEFFKSGRQPKRYTWEEMFDLLFSLMGPEMSLNRWGLSFEDIIEGKDPRTTMDRNNNGIPDYLEEDLNNNGIPDYLE